ncbi:MAG: VOC family protein [Ilumatobacteraceae bacterium]
MTDRPTRDPFTVLRIAEEAVAPQPAFVAELRAQLAAGLTGLAVAQTADQPGAQMITVTPYLTVRGGIAALDFYRDAFGAVEDHRMVGDDGRVGHAQFAIGAARFYLADEHPEIGVLGPQSYGGATCSFSVDVPDVDAAFERAVAAGATAERPPADELYGRGAWVADPFGHRWNLTSQTGVPTEQYDAGATAGGYTVTRSGHGDTNTDVATDTPDDRQIKHYEPGDLYYFTVPVPDLDRAKAFYGEVLGWRFDDAESGHAGNIAAPPGGLRAMEEPTGAELWFVVADIHDAVDAVRRAGGTASDPVLHESGWAAECTDDQGIRFNLSVPSERYSR